MRPLRLLILLLVLTIALLVALIRPLPVSAGEAATSNAKQTRKHSNPRRRRHLLAMRAARRREHRLVKYARRFIGVPYEWGGSSPRYGSDCSGFVRFVYQRFGISLPHSSYGDLSRGKRALRKYLKPGDLVFFDGGGHVGIYVGRNRLIDAPHSGAVVHVSTMSDWYSYDYYGARRLLPSS